MKKLSIILAALFVTLTVSAQNTQQEDPDLQYATELLKPGTPAPDLTLNDIDGKSVNLKDFIGKKVVLIFWASWCPDCRAEVPEIKAMHASVNPGEVAFVSISFDRTKEAFEKYVRENELPGVQLFDPAGKKDSAVANDFKVRWIPSLYVIDEKGNVQLGTVVAGKVAQILQ